MTWTVETRGPTVDAEIAAFPKDMQAAFLRPAERIEAIGLERIGAPHIKQLRGKLWQMRLSGSDGIARAIYRTANERRVVVLHVFIKKTQKTPRAALNLADQREKEME